MPGNNNTTPPVMQEVSLLELLRTVVRNQRFVIRFTTAATFLAIVVSLLLPNVYTAMAKVLPPSKDSSAGLTALLGQMGGLGGLASMAGGLGIGSSADLYLGILKSRTVTDAVIQRMDLQRELRQDNLDATRKKLQRLVKFQAAKDGIITITADFKDPRMAAMLANTFVDELSRRSIQLNLSKAGNERVFLERRLEIAKQDLRKAEDEMKEFQEKHKTIKADSQAAVAIEGIARLKAEIISREVQLAALQNSMTDENPEVRRLLAAIARLRGQMQQMSGAGSGHNVIPAVGAAPAVGVEYVRRLRNFKIQEAIFEQLTKQYELARLSEARDSSSLQVLDDAVVPLKKSKPMRALIVVLAALSSFITALAVVFVRDYFSSLSPEDATVVADIKTGLAGFPHELREMLRLRRSQI